ncbi:MAG: hypothetical protein IJT96_05150 [Lachnospiraceae bacterium]|nr:hypothetical protein [Lachnospiraceae bacterium]
MKSGSRIKDRSRAFARSMDIKDIHSVQMYSKLMQITKTIGLQERREDVPAHQGSCEAQSQQEVTR